MTVLTRKTGAQIGIFFAALAVGPLSGCATAVHGTTQTVAITSHPPGATGVIEPSHTAIVTPTQVELPRKLNHTVHLELDGYKARNDYIHREMSNAPYGNLLLGGVIGVAADIDSGAAFKLTPAVLEVRLEPVQAPSAGVATDESEETPPLDAAAP